MNRPRSRESRAVTGEISDAMRSAVLDEIRDASLDRMSDVGGYLRLISRAASTVYAIVGVWDQIADLYDMALAGYEAFTIPRRRVERVAAAHAFGWWVFQNPGTVAPKAMPEGFTWEMRESDERDRDIGRRIGNPNFSSDGGLSVGQWKNIWRTAASRTIAALESELQEKARRGVLTPPLRDALGGQARIEGQPAEAIASQYRLVVVAGGFRRSPTLAARSYLIGSLLQEDSHHARDAIVRFWARYPYRG